MNILIAQNLAQEYEYLLEQPVLSDLEAKRITAILKLAESNPSINILIRKSEQNWVERELLSPEKGCYLKQLEQLEERLNLIDEEIDKMC